MKKRTNLYQYFDIIVIFLIGLFFIIFPDFMIKWIGLLLGGYLLLKSILGFFFPLFIPLGIYQSTVYLVLGILSFVFWEFFVQFITILLGIILVISGINKILSLYRVSHNIKTWLFAFIVHLLEVIGGIAIFIASLSDAKNVLGIIIGVILLIVALSLLASQIKNDKGELDALKVEKKKHQDAEVIEAEIVSENTKDAE